LFWLLPLLQRLGFAQWLQAHPALSGASTELVGDILGLVLGRLRAAADDPVWRFAGSGDSGDSDEPASAAPPRDWFADGRLALLRSPTAGEPTPSHLMASSSRRGQLASAWVLAIRRALRRGVGIGLATLVRRSGRVVATTTHVDVHLSLDDLDLRVRRAGLDIDPGWLPWGERVVHFHYDAGSRRPAAGRPD
jgi:hypothetical protein